MKATKYKYLKVIQQGYDGDWSDASEYETDSKGRTKDRKLLVSDLAGYREMPYPVRVIKRRELNPKYQSND